MAAHLRLRTFSTGFDTLAAAHEMQARLAPLMAKLAESPRVLLEKSLENGRIHSAYLISGAGPAPVEAAVDFARGLVCGAGPDVPHPCHDCPSCQRSTPSETPIPLDAEGKRGPPFRHIGDHGDLYWIERAEQKTRISVYQVRELHKALQLRPQEGGRRVVVIADANWLSDSAESALLRLLEEPPPLTSVLLVAPKPATLLTTIRSRCVRVAFPAEEDWVLRGDEADAEVAELVEKLDAISSLGLSALLEWATEYRGQRAEAAAAVDQLLAVAGEWLRERVRREASEGGHTPGERLDAYKTLLSCRRDLFERNANPQMTAERGLFALRAALSA
ncbi:MAG: hypothetical protein VCC04_16105 [Myxococcota bacterium]